MTTIPERLEIFNKALRGLDLDEWTRARELALGAGGQEDLLVDPAVLAEVIADTDQPSSVSDPKGLSKRRVTRILRGAARHILNVFKSIPKAVKEMDSVILSRVLSVGGDIGSIFRNTTTVLHETRLIRLGLGISALGLGGGIVSMLGATVSLKCGISKMIKAHREKDREGFRLSWANLVVNLAMLGMGASSIIGNTVSFLKQTSAVKAIAQKMGVIAPCFLYTFYAGIALLGLYSIGATLKLRLELRSRNHKEMIQGLFSKQEDWLARRLGSECAKKIKTLLVGELKDVDIQKIVHDIKAACKRQILKQMLILAIAAMGIAATVLSSGAVPAALFAISAVCWLILDHGRLYEVLSHKIWADQYGPEEMPKLSKLLLGEAIPKWCEQIYARFARMGLKRE